MWDAIEKKRRGDPRAAGLEIATVRDLFFPV